MVQSPGPRSDNDDGEERAERFGMEDRPGSETSRGTTPIQHGSVPPTADHEVAQDMIMGESEGGRRQDERTTAPNDR